MNKYLLNLVFSYPGSGNPCNGLFEPYSLTNTGSAVSKAWYKVGSFPNPWQSLITYTGLQPTLGMAGTEMASIIKGWNSNPQPDVTINGTNITARPLILNCGDYVYVRVAPDSSWPSVPNIVSFICTFARVNTVTSVASPFIRATGFPLATFLTGPGSTQGGTQGDGSAIGCIGNVAIPGNVTIPGSGSYTFNVNVVASIAGCATYYDFGHDPQMDVTG